MMDNASLEFVAFGLAVAIILNLSPNRIWRSGVLLAASLAFIGILAQSVNALLPLAAFLILGYVCIRLLQAGHPRWMALCILAVIVMYAWLKRYTFLPEASFLNHPYLVLGISYIFFRVLHLIIETGEGSEPRTVSFFGYLTYTLNFTTFVCGPIQRYDDFAHDQFAIEPLPLGVRVVGSQMERVLRGFVKVNIAAMLLYSSQQDALSMLSQPLPHMAKFFAAFRVAVLYPFFLYCNFSGYIDIVIAFGRLMRVHLPENFNRPFSATSFLDFWSRWHITLSLWRKTYVYNPLLMAMMRRVSSQALLPYLAVISFFVTFFLVGIWHGRTSEFLVFGVLQGGGVATNKLWQIGLTSIKGRKSYRDLSSNPIYASLSRGLTFTWFSFTLFWFWASWRQLQSISSSLSMAEWIVLWGTIWIVAAAILSAWEFVRALLLKPSNADGPLLESRYARVIYASVFAMTVFVLSVLLNHPAPDLVYKAF